MNVTQLKLTKEQHDWINGWLELWGAWVYSGRLEKRMSSVIAQYMATVEPQGSPSRPMCNDDDGMLISQVVDSVMHIDTKALGMLISYYSHGASKRSIASYYFATAKPRKMSTRGGDRMKKPSLTTCRREVDEILAAAVWMLYQPMQHAFISRKRVGKIKKVA
ncbi:antiterminator [Yersinia ruckeri]|uniref:antiterminator Q family protein n=1 Tax=Yersinia ruckeri TaxID=29486 RepID=UPI0004E4385F|nr:antiterminator Q family protein [Yersinia ruckeri]ARZ01768.1 late gene antiterminator protein [Yersinia ruckeri]ARZ01836.1 late gene antiterminator protein [Yersinia ruckeri]KFE38542.1 late gene antiterminator protein [Yersinia ruckeri]OJB98104.1 antiterminator [Yersinia ruckeri]OJC07061.1 antiterminator [Yersinia ruckeri]